jgi:peptidoglycan/xylan/chitin deacetylase (PgdA/CDA1 family)
MLVITTEPRAGLAGCVSGSRRGLVDTPTPYRGTRTPSRSTPDEGTASPTETDAGLPQPEDDCTADPEVDVDDPLAVSTDARASRRCAGVPVDTFDTVEPWTVEGGTLRAETEDTFAGPGAARLEAPAGSERTWMRRTFPGGVDLSGQDLSLAVKLEAPSTETVAVRLAAPDYDNSILLGRRLWQAGWLRADLGPLSVNGRPDLTDVRWMTVQVYTGQGESRLLVDSLRRQQRADTGRVMLTFDGGFRSQYEVAFPLMEQYGAAGVVGIGPGNPEWDSRASVEELQELSAAGWDVASRPRMEGSLRAADPGAQMASIRASKQYLLDNGFTGGPDHVIWPSDRYDRTALQAASRFHLTGYARGTSPVGMVSDPLVVGRFRNLRLEDAKRAIDLAAAHDQLLVLSYTGVGNYRFGVGEEPFDRTLAYARDQGLEFVTATDLWDSLEGA